MGTKNTINKQGTIFLQCGAKASVIKQDVSIRSIQIAKRTNRAVECVVLCIEPLPALMAAKPKQFTLSIAHLFSAGRTRKFSNSLKTVIPSERAPSANKNYRPREKRPCRKPALAGTNPVPG